MIPQPTVYVIDDDDAVRDSLCLQLETHGFTVETFACSEDFLVALQSKSAGCLILDVLMPGMSGPELQTELTKRKVNLPIIFLTGFGDIPLAVKTVQAGAFDFLTKPVDGKHLINCVKAALALNARQHEQDTTCLELTGLLEALSDREREVLNLALEGYANKEIAKQLDISFRTVEHHRSHILLKTGASNLLQLANLIKDQG